MNIQTMTKVALVSVLAVGSFAGVRADDPAASDETPPSELDLNIPVPELPALQTPKIGREAGVSKLSDAILEGRRRGQLMPTGDVGVDEAMGFLNRNGSLLDGTVFDSPAGLAPPSPVGSSGHETPARRPVRQPGDDGRHEITGDEPLMQVPSLQRSRQNPPGLNRSDLDLPGNHAPQMRDAPAGLTPRLVRPVPVLQSVQPTSDTYLVAESLLRTARLLEKTALVDENRGALIHSMRREAARILAGPPPVVTSY